jgi:hypothetical protein
MDSGSAWSKEVLLGRTLNHLPISITLLVFLCCPNIGGPGQPISTRLGARANEGQGPFWASSNSLDALLHPVRLL